MDTTINSEDVISTVTDHCMVVTFRHKGWLYSCVADPGGDDFFIDHLTGRHLKLGSPNFDELSEAFATRELWDV